jgi:hypothetical protein
LKFAAMSSQSVLRTSVPASSCKRTVRSSAVACMVVLLFSSLEDVTAVESAG